MPKSSIASRTPSARSACRSAMTCVVVAQQQALGDLQHQRCRAAARPAAARRTSSTKPGVRNWRAETLTLTYAASRGAVARRQRRELAAAPAAAPSAPSGTIRPVSSATAMNSPARPARGSGGASAPAPRSRPARRSPVRRSAGSAATNSPRSTRLVERRPAARAARRTAVCRSGSVAPPLALAGALGRVHREVGVAQQLVGAVARPRVVAMPDAGRRR